MSRIEGRHARLIIGNTEIQATNCEWSFEPFGNSPGLSNLPIINRTNLRATFIMHTGRRALVRNARAAGLSLPSGRADARRRHRKTLKRRGHV